MTLEAAQRMFQLCQQELNNTPIDGSEPNSFAQTFLEILITIDEEIPEWYRNWKQRKSA